MHSIQSIAAIIKRSASALARLLLCASLSLLPIGAKAIPGQPGTLDASWATLSPLGAGKVITPIGTSNDFGSAIAVQPDGKIVLAGQCSNDFCALRYNANGTLDTNFGAGGKVIAPIGTSGFAHDMALQPDGKIVQVGNCLGGSNLDMCAVRYHANGTLDTTFGTSGKVITPVATGEDYAIAMALQPDGKIVLAGDCANSAAFPSFCALRYLTNGTLDTTFETDGKVITPIGSLETSGSYARAIALQPDGKIVLAGYCSNGTDSDFCALRYNPNGALDLTFGTSGKVITPIGASHDTATAVALQPDGKIVLAGYCSIKPFLGTNTDDFCALRYNANGTLDTTFGSSGKVTTTMALGQEHAFAMVLQLDGKIVLAGSCLNDTLVGATEDFCAVRYNAEGALDTTFGTGGKVTTQVGTTVDRATAMALQPDGKIVLAGRCGNGTDFDFCAVRYDGGPFGYRNCAMDIDGDGLVSAAIDSVIHSRVALGMTGANVIGGITFPTNASRNTWPEIREYLITQCGMSIP